MRIRMIEDILSKKRKVKEVAEILGVTRKTVHKWKCRYTYYGPEGMIPKKPGPKKGKAWNRTDNETEKVVVKYARKHKEEGPLRLCSRLKEEEGIVMDQCTVYRILKRRHTRYHQEYVRPKKKAKLYALNQPGRELQVDTSFPFGYHRKFVIYTAIDDCTRMVYSKAYSNRKEGSSLDFMKEIMKRYPFRIKSIRTDQGREFSRKVTQWLDDRGIGHIRNEPYRPEHNGKVERYHRTMKDGEVRKWPYLISITDANYMLRQRTAYYNNQRPHTGLGMNGKSPWKKREELSQNVTLILQ